MNLNAEGGEDARECGDDLLVRSFHCCWAYGNADTTAEQLCGVAQTLAQNERLRVEVF